MRIHRSVAVAVLGLVGQCFALGLSTHGGGNDYDAILACGLERQCLGVAHDDGVEFNASGTSYRGNYKGKGDMNDFSRSRREQRNQGKEPSRKLASAITAEWLSQPKMTHSVLRHGEDGRTKRSRLEYLHHLGDTPKTNRPRFIPIESFTELSWLVGPMGSGKTVAACRLAERMIELGFSVLYLDLKGGSGEVPATLLGSGAKRGCACKCLSIARDYPTYGLNICGMDFWQNLTARQRAHFLLAILGIEHDLSQYGPGFFTTCSAEVASFVFEQHPSVSNWREFAENVLNVLTVRPAKIPADLLKNAGHLGGALNRICELDALNITEDPSFAEDAYRERIDFSDPFLQQEVHYYHLPVGRGSQLSPETGRLVVRGLLSAAENLSHRRQVFLFIDEWQILQSHVLNACFSTSRSLNIGVILVNQSPSQIIDRSVLANVVDGTRFRQWFGLGLDGQRWFEEGSGKRIGHLNSWTVGDTDNGAVTSQTVQEILLPHFSINDLRRITADPSLSIYEFVRGTPEVPSDGLPQVVRSFYTISKTEYERRMEAIWPDERGTFRPSPAPTIGPNEPPVRPDIHSDY